jgi:hypothetical protein
MTTDNCTPRCPKCERSKRVIPSGDNYHTFACLDCNIQFEDIDDGDVGRGRPEKFAVRNERLSRQLSRRR